MEGLKLAKLWGVALLFAVGAGLTAIGFLGVFPKQITFWGVLCLIAGSIWIYLDQKKRVLTWEEETEKIMLKAVKRLRRTRSVEKVMAEFRAEGYSENTIALISQAPDFLSQRAGEKIHQGVILFGGGCVVLLASGIFLHSIHVVAYGALGAGAGLIIQGLWFRRASRV